MHSEAVDGRKNINGLALLVEQALGLDLFAPALFVFGNRRRDRIRILFWDRNGFWLLTESALAWVVTSKYMDALPLYRQATLLGRFGGELSRTGLAASVIKVGYSVQPIINLLRDHLLDADPVHADKTVIQVLKEAGWAAQTGRRPAGRDRRSACSGTVVA